MPDDRNLRTFQRLLAGNRSKHPLYQRVQHIADLEFWGVAPFCICRYGARMNEFKSQSHRRPNRGPLLGAIITLLFAGCIEAPQTQSETQPSGSTPETSSSSDESTAPAAETYSVRYGELTDSDLTLNEQNQGYGEVLQHQPCLDGAACPGSPWPTWELEDFQPNSPRLGETYGLDTFRGEVTVVALLAAWCGYCRSQALHLDRLHQELLAEGYRVQVAVVNKANAADPNYQDSMIHVLDDNGDLTYDDQNEPIYRCRFPLFQDTDAINAWELHNGGKDDFFIYNTDGRVVAYLPHGGEIVTRLSSEIGYYNLKQAIIAAMDVD